MVDLDSLILGAAGHSDRTVAFILIATVLDEILQLTDRLVVKAVSYCVEHILVFATTAADGARRVAIVWSRHAMRGAWLLLDAPV